MLLFSSVVIGRGWNNRCLVDQQNWDVVNDRIDTLATEAGQRFFIRRIPEIAVAGGTTENFE
jgi:hypothetical protein